MNSTGNSIDEISILPSISDIQLPTIKPSSVFVNVRELNSRTKQISTPIATPIAKQNAVFLDFVLAGDVECLKYYISYCNDSGILIDYAVSSKEYPYYGNALHISIRKQNLLTFKYLFSIYFPEFK